MEENQQNIASPGEERVGFPAPPPPQQPKKGINKGVLIIVALFAVVGVAGFLLLRSSGQSIEPGSTPSTLGSSLEQPVDLPQDTPSPTPKTTATPQPVDKKNIAIQVLNATGIAGEAGYLKDQLTALGYEKIDTGNASSQNATKTIITYSSTVAKAAQDEITSKLQGIYKEVEVKTGSSGAGIDIQIQVGLRKGATPKPSASASTSTPKASSSASPLASASPKPSPTP